MRFEPKLIRGHLVRRYKRFLADVRLDAGPEVTAHCPNPGSMLDVGIPGQPVALSHSDNPKRKLAYTWEMIELDGGWVAVHTGRTNALVEEALAAGGIEELAGFAHLRREVRQGASRLDFELEGANGQKTFIEVKNVTLTDGGHRAIFPDSVTVRGQKHLRELMTVAAAGHRAVMLFIVNRNDCDEFSPADQIDPEYGRLLRQAASRGVEILAYRTRVSPKQVTVDRSIRTVLEQ